MLLSFLIPVLILAKAITAQICDSATATVDSAAAASSLALECSIISGSLLISSPATGEIVFDGIDAIDGKMICEHADSITGISSSTLANVSDSVQIGDNSALRNISLPFLAQVYDNLQVYGNKDLGIVSFPGLNTVDGSVSLDGTFNSTEFPTLTEVDGNLDISTSNSIDCSAIVAALSSSVKGGYTCNGTNDHTSGGNRVTVSSSLPSSSSLSGLGSGTDDGPVSGITNNYNTSQASGLSTGAIAGIVLATVLALSGVAAAVFFWGRLRERKRNGFGKGGKGLDEKETSMSGGLGGSQVDVEMQELIERGAVDGRHQVDTEIEPNEESAMRPNAGTSTSGVARDEVETDAVAPYHDTPDREVTEPAAGGGQRDDVDADYEIISPIGAEDEDAHLGSMILAEPVTVAQNVELDGQTRLPDMSEEERRRSLHVNEGNPYELR